MYIVEDGESDYYIVTADEHDECIDTAAEELYNYFVEKYVHSSHALRCVAASFTEERCIHLIIE